MKPLNRPITNGADGSVRCRCSVGPRDGRSDRSASARDVLLPHREHSSTIAISRSEASYSNWLTDWTREEADDLGQGLARLGPGDWIKETVCSTGSCYAMNEALAWI